MLRRGGLRRLASGEENSWKIAQSFRVENQEKWVEVELPGSLNNWQMIRKWDYPDADSQASLLGSVIGKKC